MGNPTRCKCGRLPNSECTGKGCRAALTDAFDQMRALLNESFLEPPPGWEAKRNEILERTAPPTAEEAPP